MQRDFKGIWIPKEIWLSPDLTLMEKLMLVEIDSLDNEKGCFASNAYFAKFFDLSQTRISQIINSLVQKGYIISEVLEAEGNTRILRGVLKKSLRPSYNKVQEGLKEKFKHNNTSRDLERERGTRSASGIPVNPEVDETLESFLSKVREIYGTSLLSNEPRWVTAIIEADQAGITPEQFASSLSTLLADKSRKFPVTPQNVIDLALNERAKKTVKAKPADGKPVFAH